MNVSSNRHNSSQHKYTSDIDHAIFNKTLFRHKLKDALTKITSRFATDLMELCRCLFINSHLYRGMSS